MKLIDLPRKLKAMVDDEDYERLSSVTWHLYFSVRADGTCKVYPRTSVYREGRSPLTVFMHQMVMPCGAGLEADHVSGNTLDNRKENLRPATHQQNIMNSEKYRGNKHSQYKGVTKHSANGSRWRSRIRHNNVLICIGNYDSEEEAARAYDTKALELFGPFARINFPEVERFN